MEIRIEFCALNIWILYYQSIKIWPLSTILIIEERKIFIGQYYAVSKTRRSKNSKANIPNSIFYGFNSIIKIFHLTMRLKKYFFLCYEATRNCWFGIWFISNGSSYQKLLLLQKIYSSDILFWKPIFIIYNEIHWFVNICCYDLL